MAFNNLKEMHDLSQAIFDYLGYIYCIHQRIRYLRSYHFGCQEFSNN